LLISIELHPLLDKVRKAGKKINAIEMKILAPLCKIVKNRV